MPVAFRGVIELEHDVNAIAAESRFSGAVRIDRGDEVVLERAYGLARRDSEQPTTPATQFATASGLKGMTALAVMGLVADGVLALETTALERPRCGRLVPLAPRPRDRHDLHRRLELDRRRVAAGKGAHRAAVSLGRRWASLVLARARPRLSETNPGLCPAVHLVRSRRRMPRGDV